MGHCRQLDIAVNVTTLATIIEIEEDGHGGKLLSTRPCDMQGGIADDAARNIRGRLLGTVRGRIVRDLSVNAILSMTKLCRGGDGHERDSGEPFNRGGNGRGQGHCC